MRFWTRAAATALLAHAAVCAQGPSPRPADAATPPLGLALTLDLAEDRGRTGPPAWVWVRGELPSLVADWPRGRDPWAPLRLEIDLETGDVGIAESEVTATEPPYLRAQLTTDAGPPLLTGSMDSAGYENWALAPDAPEWPDRLRFLAELLQLERPGLLCFDVGALASHMTEVGAIHDASPTQQLVTRGASECDVVCFVTEQTDDGLVVASGQGGGGLSLTAAVLALAEIAGHGGTMTTRRDVDPAERWRLLAYASRDPAGFEAAAQLARLGDADAVDVLRRLLWHEGPTRVGAMHGLIRAGSQDSLPQLMAAVDDEVPGTQGLGDAAIANLWEDASAATRSAAIAEISAAPPGGAGSTSRPPTPETQDPRRSLQITAAASLAASLVVLLSVYLRLTRRAGA